MINIFTPFALSFVAIYLGFMGFSRGGLPWTKNKNITGKPARVVGACCLLLGGVLFAIGAWFLVQLGGR